VPGASAKDGEPLVHGYRSLGHYIGKLDPLGHNRASHALLEVAELGFSTAELGRRVGTGGFLGATDGTLRDLLTKLRLTYCQTLAMEYMEIADQQRRAWLQRRAASTPPLLQGIRESEPSSPRASPGFTGKI
jgi:2-oxoglutarate dehydrogenase complex dehydrogenase (E1) component-like enzyme